MSKNWQNDRYAQTMMKAIISVPRSDSVCVGSVGGASGVGAGGGGGAGTVPGGRWVGFWVGMAGATPTLGGASGPGGCSRSDTTISAATANTKPDRTCPMPKIAMKIVEYQCGSSDITQSIEAKVMVSAYRMMPGPLRPAQRSLMAGLLAVS